ncbi:MAG: hypothetical protein ACOCRX_11395 [Candidatus Woesearchaeota archaeon]
MNIVYIDEGTPIEGSEQADVTLYYLSEKKPNFIVSIHGFLPKLKASFRQLEPHYITIENKNLAQIVWENAQGAMKHPEDNEFKYVNTIKATSELEQLFIKTTFDESVEIG